MATASMQKFFSFPRQLLLGQHVIGTHVFKLLLSNTLPDVNAATVLANITQIAAGTGYTLNGHTITLSLPGLAGTPTPVIMAGITWTATGAMGPFRYVILYNSSVGSNLIGMWDIGVAVTLQSGDTFKVTPDPAAGIFTL